MTNCRHTGLSVPECSCRPCLEAQLAQHQPDLLAENAQQQSQAADMRSYTPQAERPAA